MNKVKKSMTFYKVGEIFELRNSNGNFKLTI